MLQDFELLIVALDRDYFPVITFDFVDAFIFPLEGLRQGRTEDFDEHGENNNIELFLELTLICEEGYTGELCDSEELVTTPVMGTESPTTETIVTELPATIAAMTTEVLTTTDMIIEPPLLQ